MENGDKIKFTDDIATLKAEMNFVKKQVSNHLPTSLREMAATNKEEHDLVKGMIRGLEKRFGKLDVRLATWGGGIAAVIVIAQIIISKYL